MAVAGKRSLWLVFFMTMAGMGIAQNTPPLERSITLECTDEPVEKVLKLISKEAKVVFSYTAADLGEDNRVTASFKAKTVREVLEQVFKGSLSFKEKGKYIILTKNQPPQKTSAALPKPPFFINGYVVNAATGEKLAGVSIHDVHSLTAAVTDRYGYFNLMLKDPQSVNRLSVARKHYADTTLAVQEDTYVFLNIPLVPEINPEVPVTVMYDTVTRVQRDTVTVFVEAPAQQDTIPREPVKQMIDPVSGFQRKDTLAYRLAQASLVPFIGTNGMRSGKIINTFSLNLVGGYSAGVQGIEVGGIFNTTRVRMQGFQAAGGANVNNGRSDGVQVAGGVNIQRGKLRGVQLAGAANVSLKRMKGVQLAPLFNYARNLRGMQIAFVNVADTLRGVPLGFISYVKRGYHKLEFSADEIFYTNISFRTGTHKFYNIFTFGVKPENYAGEEDRRTEWTFGYGFGMAPYIFDWLYLNIDLTSNQLSKGEFTKAINLLNKAYIGLEIQPFDRIGIAFGVTLNGYLTKDSYDGYYDIFTNYRPKIIKEHSYNNNTHLVMWWGYKAAIRFF